MDRKVAKHLYYNSGYKGIDGVDGLEARLTAIENDNAVASITNVTAATYTVLGTEELIIVNRGSAVAITLPAAVAGNVGFGFMIKNVGAGTATLNRAGSDTIDGGASLALTTNQAAHIVVTAAGAWRSINTDIAAMVEAAITAADIQGDVDAAIVAADIPGEVASAIVDADIPGEVASAITAADIQGDVDAAIAANATVALLTKAIDGDIVMEITPATIYVTAAAAADGFSEAVTVTLKTASGETHTWLNGALSVSIADSSAGTASLSSATPAITNGVATFNVIGDAAAWADNDTATATVANLSVLGYTITGGTAVVEITE